MANSRVAGQGAAVGVAYLATGEGAEFASVLGGTTERKMAGCGCQRLTSGERKMKKDFGIKTWLLPMPVLMVATYGEDGMPNAMNAAWGGTGGDDLLTLCIDNAHKTWANLEKRRAFTVSVGTEGQVKMCDHLGCISGYKEADKVAKAGWTVEKSPWVDAPRINELPLAFECEVVSMDAETCLVVGKVVNVAVDEAVLTDGKPDTDKIKPLAYDTLKHVYRGLTSPVARAFQG